MTFPSARCVSWSRPPTTTRPFASTATSWGCPSAPSYSSPDGQVVFLEAGRATLEIADPAQAEFIDQVEVGRRVAGHIRVAFAVADSAETAHRLAANGATILAEATLTPWQDLNARLEARVGFS